MEPTTAGTLALLALVDSTSLGTLLIPVCMLLAPRMPARKVVLYAGTVAGSYFVVGVVLLAGATGVADLTAALAENRPLRVGQLVVGALLVVLSVVLERRRGRGEEPASRLVAWQDSITAGSMHAPAVVVMALGATVLEVATMLPYLAAIGLLTGSSLTALAQVGSLAGYVGIMVAPAMILLAVRECARRRVDSYLERLAALMRRRSASITEWVVGIVGALVLLDALSFFMQ